MSTIAVGNKNIIKSSEPWWLTYLKAILFLAPPLLTWTVMMVFCVPKLKQIYADAGGLPLPSILQGAAMAFDNITLVWIGLLSALIMLELTLRKRPSIRRPFFGFLVFLINTAAVVSIGSMVITALMIVPQLSAR